MVSSDSTDDDLMAGPSGSVANGANCVTVQAEVHDPPLMLPQVINGEFYFQVFPQIKDGCKHGFCVNL